jgi:hypothetical protein
MIEPSRDTLQRKVTTDEAIANAIIRHGTSKYVVTVGDKDEVPPDAVFTAIKNELEDITEQNEFIVPGPISIKTIDEQGIRGVEEYYNYFQTQLVVGLMCPEEALGLGANSTEATSKVKEILYERFIKAVQHKLAEQLRKDVINPFLEQRGFDINTVNVRFNSVTDADEAKKAKWLGNLLRGYPEGEKPFTVNEIRSIFDYPPKEEIEDDIPETGGKPSDDEKKPKDDTEETTEEKPTEEPKEKETKKEQQSQRMKIKELYNVVEDMKEEIEELRNVRK